VLAVRRALLRIAVRYTGALNQAGCSIAVSAGDEARSRWSARSEARTNDLDVGEEWRRLFDAAGLG
jgi:hypothetical protein